MKALIGQQQPQEVGARLAQRPACEQRIERPVCDRRESRDWRAFPVFAVPGDHVCEGLQLVRNSVGSPRAMITQPAPGHICWKS
jgi:hypothetical protein